MEDTFLDRLNRLSIEDLRKDYFFNWVIKRETANSRTNAYRTTFIIKILLEDNFNYWYLCGPRNDKSMEYRNYINQNVKQENDGRIIITSKKFLAFGEKRNEDKILYELHTINREECDRIANLLTFPFSESIYDYINSKYIKEFNISSEKSDKPDKVIKNIINSYSQVPKENPDDCCVCSEPWHKYVWFGCGHNICKECLMKMIKTNGTSNLCCPMCRRKII